MNLLQQIFPIGLIILLVPSSAIAQPSDTPITITGSSTVYPFMTNVADHYSHNTGYAYPVIEAIGTRAGMKAFCTHSPDSPETNIDIAAASRRILPIEEQECLSNNIVNTLEIKIGHDGIGLTRSRLSSEMTLSLKEIYLALAKTIPVIDTETGQEELVDNPYGSWPEINPDLPDEPIQFYGPPITSGTRDAFDELVLLEGCLDYRSEILPSLDPFQSHFEGCSQIREDGVYSEIGENDDLIIQRLQTNDTAIGIIGYNFLNRNRAILDAIPISHAGSKPQLPSKDNIKNGNYPISRNLYLYIKRDQLNTSNALKAFVQELISDNALGKNGYLLEEGLIPLSQKDRDTIISGLRAEGVLENNNDDNDNSDNSGDNTETQ